MDTGEDMVDTEVAMEDMEAIEVMEDITVERGTLRLLQKLKLLQKLMLHQMLTDMVGMEVMEDMELTMGMAMEDTEVAMGDIIVVKERLTQMPTDMDMVMAMAMVMEVTEAMLDTEDTLDITLDNLFRIQLKLKISMKFVWTINFQLAQIFDVEFHILI